MNLISKKKVNIIATLLVASFEVARRNVESKENSGSLFTGHCPSSGMLITRKCKFTETGPLSALR
jgi:hypothetical protein